MCCKDWPRLQNLDSRWAFLSVGAGNDALEIFVGEPTKPGARAPDQGEYVGLIFRIDSWHGTAAGSGEISEKMITTCPAWSFDQVVATSTTCIYSAPLV